MYKIVDDNIEKSIECWKIIIPRSDNNKLPFDTKIIEEIKSSIINEFGALSSVNISGAWRDGERLYHDESIQIIIDIIPNENSSKFFSALKLTLFKKLNQEKIYLTKESSKSEIITINEFLDELGYEVSPYDNLELTQENVNKLVTNSEWAKRRFTYKTISLERDISAKKIIWEREILGIKITTLLDDEYSLDYRLVPADRMEELFDLNTKNSKVLVIGDYEYQSYILDTEKRRYIANTPRFYELYDIDKTKPYYHPWFGELSISEFIITFSEQVLINYIILRENSFKKEQIKINVGSDGSLQVAGEIMMSCFAKIEDKKIQLAIMDNLELALQKYEKGIIDDIALEQAKVLNRYQQKIATFKSKII